ncbi:MAG: LytR/AlgR family response regulator transcription factor [Bacteroidales bacterium]
MKEKNRIKALIIDDEEPARSLIRYYLEKHDSVEVAGECPDGYCGLLSIKELKPDLLFLDIQMPRITGFELLEVLEEKPEIIFTTAYDEYAIRAFDLNAVDYLLKPFPEKRFYEAVDKAIQRIRTGNKTGSGDIRNLTTGTPEGSAPLRRIIIRKGSAISFISVSDIQYIQAEDDYVMIYHAGGKALKQQTMKYYEQQLPQKEFVRIHRSYIVAIEQISRVEPYGKDTHIAIMKDGKRLPVSRSGYKKLML